MRSFVLANELLLIPFAIGVAAFLAYAWGAFRRRRGHKTAAGQFRVVFPIVAAVLILILLGVPLVVGGR